MSNHSEFFKFGTKHCCKACAWMFCAGKSRPGNYLATPERYEEVVISMDSIVESKRPWLSVLSELIDMPQDTPVVGVLTTDVKPRLWPRARLATVGRFGLYIHAPDYDVSEYREFDLSVMISIVHFMRPILLAGFAKASLYFGLLRDFNRASNNPSESFTWETELEKLRPLPSFLPALIISGVTKEEKSNVKSASPSSKPRSSTEKRNRIDKAQSELF